MDLAPKLLYSKKEAAGMLSVSLRSLEYLLARGEIKFIRKGSRTLIHHNELERWAKKDDPRPIRRERAEGRRQGAVQLRLG
jgi:excisionase family DNA binding protein